MFPTLLISMSCGVYTLATGARIAPVWREGKGWDVCVRFRAIQTAVIQMRLRQVIYLFGALPPAFGLPRDFLEQRSDQVVSWVPACSL